MSEELTVHVISEKKKYMFLPFTRRENNGMLCAYKYLITQPFGCSAEKLGQDLIDTFDFIVKNPTHSFADERENREVYYSWKKSEVLCVNRNGQGDYSIEVRIRDFRLNYNDLIDVVKISADASALQLGQALLSCFERCEMYAKRAQLMLFLSDTEGLGICSMAVARQGNYVLSDYCEHLMPPYDSVSLKAAIDCAAEHCRNNPDTALSKKELKENAPWKSYSAYKSWHGFVKHNHAIRLMVLPDGSYNFSPEMRFDDYDSDFVPYSCLATELDGSCSDERLYRRVFKTFENSRYLTESSGGSWSGSYVDYFDGWLAERGLPSWRPTDED